MLLLTLAGHSGKVQRSCLRLSEAYGVDYANPLVSLGPSSPLVCAAPQVNPGAQHSLLCRATPHHEMLCFSYARLAYHSITLSLR